MNIKKHIALFAVLLCAAVNADGQYSFKAVIKDKATHTRLAGVVVADHAGHGSATDDSGRVVVSGLAAGAATFTFQYLGYVTDSIAITMPDDREHEVLLAADEGALEEVVVVAATRTNEKIENSPTKVEVLGLEEMGEENTIRPANIASILGDVSGVQIQQSSAVSGNMNVRIQGLNGQYTQILRDGMPLYDGLSGGFGILQIPPLDLRQIELIKGSASTLYGGGAIAGLINLVSKRPGNKQEAVFTLNATTLNEQDVNAYVAKRYKKVGYTLFAGYIHQGAVDVNNDGFSDVPQLGSFTLHPRLLFYLNDKTTVIAGYNGTYEQRKGGDMQVLNNQPDSTHRYYEQNSTQRHTGELILERTLGATGAKFTLKGSASSFYKDVTTNTSIFKGNQLNYYGEASVFVPQGRNSIVAGINTTGDDFKKQPGTDSIALPDYSNNILGAFAQYTLHLGERTTIEGGLRADHTSHYGDFVLPRLTFFHRFSDQWAMRAGAGLGYKTPNPLTVQVIDYAIQDLRPLPAGMAAERSGGYNLEGNFKKDITHDVSLFVNHAFFLTQVADPVVATQLTDGSVVFGNAGKEINTMGFDTYVKLVVKGVELYLGYTYTDAQRTYLAQNQFVPLTPRNRAAFTAVKEFTDKWRIGLEGSYTGSQYRDNDSKTPGYMFAAVMLERKIGKMYSIVLNCENLFDYRQTKYEQIYYGSRISPTFKPLWAPIDGRVVNLAVRIMPFNK